MYKDDQAVIREFALQCPQNLLRVGVFVQATINQHFEQVPAIMRRYTAQGLQASQLRTVKKQGIEAFAARALWLHGQLLHGDMGQTALIRAVVEMPGFGITKAAFVAQLVLDDADVGCLDRHNLRRLGLKEKLFAYTPVGAEFLTSRIMAYVQLCRVLGGAEVLWDDWCHYLSLLRPKVFPTADAVSKLHVQCIVGG